MMAIDAFLIRLTFLRVKMAKITNSRLFLRLITHNGGYIATVRGCIVGDLASLSPWQRFFVKLPVSLNRTVLLGVVP